MSKALWAGVVSIVVAGIVWDLVRWASVTLALRRVRGCGIARGARVGILILCDDTPVHTRRGAWSTSAQSLACDWRLNAEVTLALQSTLADEGLVAVDLQASDLQLAHGPELVTPRRGRWHVTDPALLQRLRQQGGLSALIVVKTGPVTALVEGGDVGAIVSVQVPATGLLTMADCFSQRHRAVIAQDWQVYRLDPPANLRFMRPLRRMLDIPSVALPHLSGGRGARALSPQDLESVRHAVITFIRQVAATAVAGLKAGGEGPCPS